MLWPVQFVVNALCYVLPCQQWESLKAIQAMSNQTHRVAIIGAGAAGSSAAFWLAKGHERTNAHVTIDVYDRVDYIGGRSTVVNPYDSLEQPLQELGASIFVKANKNLMRAAKEFNLTLLNFDDDSDVTGVWDGQRILIKFGGKGWIDNWWNKVQIIWRYGYHAPSRTIKLVKDMINSYDALYSPSPPLWRNISEVAAQLKFTSYVAQTMSEYLDSNGIDRRWTREMVEAATRVNYGQNVDEIHALGGMCSMAATGAHSVKGGNYQIFEHFVAYSNAKVYLNTTVTKLEHSQSKWALTSSRGTKTYDSVIIAAPLISSPLSSPIEIIPPLEPFSDPPEYVHLHVTLLSTTSQRMNTTYLNDKSPPRDILTSFNAAREGEKAPVFNSISYHQDLVGDKEGAVVKIFSVKKLTNKWLSKVFDGNVGWVYRKEWDSYPVLKTRVEFPPVEPAEGLYYVNAFEPFMSTMETQTIASRNIVDLLFLKNFNSTICSEAKSKTPTTKTQDSFVYGWDC